MDDEIIRVDGIKWWKTKNTQGSRLLFPICPKHDLRIYPFPTGRVLGSNGRLRDMWDSEAKSLKCEEGPHFISIPRELSDEKRYVGDRIDAKIFANMPTIDLDGELTPVAKAKDKDSKFFVTSQIMDSRRGPQVVIYAGEVGKKNKTQIFADSKNEKLSFDHNDLSPSDIFLEVKATFDSGLQHTISKKNSK